MVDFVTNEGERHYKVPSDLYKEWATNVLNLLHRTFGQSSIHYKNLLSTIQNSAGGYQILMTAMNFPRCKGRLRRRLSLQYSNSSEGRGSIWTLLVKLRNCWPQNTKTLPAFLPELRLSPHSRTGCRYDVSEGKPDRMNADLTKAGELTIWAAKADNGVGRNWQQGGSRRVESLHYTGCCGNGCRR